MVVAGLSQSDSMHFMDVTTSHSSPVNSSRELEQIYEALEGNQEGVWEWNVEGDRIYLGPLCRKILEVGPNELPQPLSFWERAIHEEDRERVIGQLRRCASGALQKFRAEARLKRGKEWLWVSVRGTAVGQDSRQRALKVVGMLSNLTRQKAAEETVADHDVRWRDLMALAPVGIYQTDLNGIFIYGNEAWFRLTGKSRREVLGHAWIKEVFEDDRERVVAEWNACRKENRPFNVQYRYRGNTGPDRWMLGNAVALTNGAGEKVGYLGTIQDIGRIRGLQERLSNFVENIPAGAIFIEGETVTLNRACEKIIGFSREEITSVNDWLRVVNPQDIPRYRKVYERVRAGGYIERPILPINRKDGETRFVEVVGVNGGTFEIWHLNDLTERLQAEEKFQALFESSSDGKLVIEGGKITGCNLAAVSLIGLAKKEDLIGVQPLAFSPASQPGGKKSAEVYSGMEEVARIKGRSRFEWVLLRSDGAELPVEVTLTSVSLGGRPATLTTWHDLTSQKEAQAKVTQSLKMASLGEMAGGLAHEINNPLTIIKTKAEQIALKIEREKTIDPDWLREKVTVVDQTVDRIAKIIKGLKNFARDSRFDPMKSTDLRLVIEDTLSFCSARFSSHNISLKVKLPKLPLLLECRSVELSQVFLNLLNNAFDAVEGTSRAWIRLEARQVQGQVEISFTDSGPGVAKEHRAKIMQPFFTTKEVGKGTGLGLSISRGIVEAHGGKLFLDEAAASTRFVVMLPLVQSKNRKRGRK